MAETTYSVLGSGAFGTEYEDMLAGGDFVAADQANDMVFYSSDWVLMVVYNGSAGSLDLVVVGVASNLNAGVATDVTISTGAGEISMYPIYVPLYNQGGGKVKITCADDGSDGLKVAFIQMKGA